MWNDIVLKLKQKNNETAVLLSAWKSRPCYIAIRFEKEISAEWRILGDEWERTYGDMAWQPMIPHKRLSWYFLITKDHRTCGVGVKIRPGAMCFWQIDETGITLFLDVRCGGKGVSLSGRVLNAAVLVSDTYEGIRSFDAARLFCPKMCQDGIFPNAPIYGSNNWYYAYGDISHETVLADADCVGITGKIDWKWNRQWAELLAYSGTPLFLSVKPGPLSADTEEELKAYMKTASIHHKPAVPLDWENTACPKCWDTDAGQKEFNWYMQKGIPYGDF